MPTLAQVSGIPTAWNADRDDLIFDPRLIVKEVKARTRGALRPVVPDDAACAPADAVQYWMYNGISLPEHQAAFARLGIQYELTLIYPTRLGSERSKTLGHRHAFAPGKRYNAPEVCEVVYGEAFFLCQTLDLANKSASFCYAVHAKAGDKVVFAPNTHHLTINALDDLLLFSDLIDVDTRGDYAGLSAMQGGAYLYDEAGWRANPTYRAAAPLTVIDAPAYPHAGLAPDVPLYTLIERQPEALRWLREPESFGAHFPDLWAWLPDALRSGEG